MGKLSLIFLFLLTTQIAHLQYRKPLIIDIYFETLCPDSLYFIKHQLVPIWRYIKDYVYIRFIPFGKGKISGNGTDFQCQHGPRECEGNRMVSCALNQIDTQSEQVQYVDCFMSTFRRARIFKDEFGEKCAQDLKLDWREIVNCYNSEEGTNLQLEAQAMTNKINPTFIPTVVYNEMYDQYLQDTSLVNMQMVVCVFLSKGKRQSFGC